MAPNLQLRVHQADPQSNAYSASTTASVSSIRSITTSSSTALPTVNVSRGARALSGEARTCFAECLASILRNPACLPELWINYDCDVKACDIMELVVAFLSDSVVRTLGNFPQVGARDQSLDALLLILRGMAERNVDITVNGNDHEATNSDSIASAKETSQTRKLAKRKMIIGAGKFNTSPTAGIDYFKQSKFIESTEDASAQAALNTAKFLKSTPRLNKKLLGEYLAKPKNRAVLEAYIGLFDFGNKRLDEAMRLMLESFRLPGEAQQIERVMETFANVYISHTKTEDVASTDAAFVLAFSIIMLNTDLHNPQVRKRMTFEEYTRNLRGVNNRHDFDPAYLKNIYNAIREKEIVMPEEQIGALGFNYTWREMIVGRSGETEYAEYTGNAYDEQVFSFVWEPIVATLTTVFELAQDDITFQKAIAGFRLCAQLAAKFGQSIIMDGLVASLAKLTGLLSGSNDGITEGRASISSSAGSNAEKGTSRNANEPASATHTEDIYYVAGRAEQKDEVPVSEMSVSMGRNYKCQMALATLFLTTGQHQDHVHYSWSYVLSLWIVLFKSRLLPKSMLQVAMFQQSESAYLEMPKKAVNIPSKQERKELSIFSSFTSNWLVNTFAGTDSVEKPTDDDVENTLNAIQCISLCRFNDIYYNLFFLSNESILVLGHLLSSLVTLNLKPKPADNRALRSRGFDRHQTEEKSQKARTDHAIAQREPDSDNQTEHENREQTESRTERSVSAPTPRYESLVSSTTSSLPPSVPATRQNGDVAPAIATDPIDAFFVELLCNLTCYSRYASDPLQAILNDCLAVLASCSVQLSRQMLDRTATSILRLCAVMAPDASKMTSVMSVLALLVEFSDTAFAHVSDVAVAGLLRLIPKLQDTNPGPIDLSVIRLVLSRCSPQSEPAQQDLDNLNDLIHRIQS